MTKLTGALSAVTVAGIIASIALSEGLCFEYADYNMTVVDGDISAKVSICEDEAGITEKKEDLLNKVSENRIYSLESDVSPSVEALLIAMHDEIFFDELKTELLKKYDSSSHVFIGSKLDADYKEQRALFFALANFKCNNNCTLTGESVNEIAYNLLEN